MMGVTKEMLPQLFLINKEAGEVIPLEMLRKDDDIDERTPAMMLSRAKQINAMILKEKI